MATTQGRVSTRAALETSRKHLIFSLGDEEFGIPVLNVKEIVQMQEITAVPKSPVYVKGVLNLRGQVLPILDLSVRFDIPQQQITPHTCIVVVRLATAEGERFIGAVADGVSEVLSIPEEDIEPVPNFGSKASIDYLLGMAKVRGEIKLLLNTDSSFGIEDGYGLN